MSLYTKKQCPKDAYMNRCYQIFNKREDLLSYMHQPIQPKNLSWWGEVGNSLIFQHSPSRGDSLRPQTWNRSEQQLFYLIALTRIRTRDLWLWYHIELHAPTNTTQKLKLMGRGGQFTYIAIGLIITLNLKIYNEHEYKDTTKSFSVTKTYLNENTLLAKKEPGPLQWRWSDFFSIST